MPVDHETVSVIVSKIEEHAKRADEKIDSLARRVEAAQLTTAVDVARIATRLELHVQSTSQRFADIDVKETRDEDRADEWKQTGAKIMLGSGLLVWLWDWVRGWKQ